jgi:hypothetical protein
MGLQDFQRSAKEIFSFENLMILLTVGLFIAQIAMQIATKWFGYTGKGTGFMAGPYIILLVAAGAVLLGFAILRRSYYGAPLSKPAIALLIVTGLILGFILINFRALTAGTLFEVSAENAASMLGIG